MGLSPEAFGAHVRLLRQERAWSLRDLATFAGLPLARVDRIEKARTRDVTLDDIVRLADAFGIPSSWLVRGPLVRNRVLAAARTSDARLAQDAVGRVIHVLELADQLSDRLSGQRADRLSGGRASRHSGARRPPRIHIPREADETPAGWGRRAARAIRRRANAETGPIEDLPAFIEQHCSAFVVIDDFPDGVDGLSLVDPETGFAVAAAATTPHLERQRFTLAHELGHLAAGEMQIEGVIPGAARKPSEVAANEFAAHLLLPAADLIRASKAHEWTLERVARAAWDYRVSPSVVARQLERADLISRAQAQAATTIPADAWSRFTGCRAAHNAVCSGTDVRRVPPELADAALKAWKARQISEATLGRLLGMTADAIRASLADLGISQTQAA